MKTGYKIINEDYVTTYNNQLKGIVVYNYDGINEVVNHFLGYIPTKYDQISNSCVVGFWKLKSN